MRKGRDGEQNKTKQNKRKKSDGNSDPLTSLPVGLPKVDRLQRRRSCQCSPADETAVKKSLIAPGTLMTSVYQHIKFSALIVI